jgi:hypothetical protein
MEPILYNERKINRTLRRELEVRATSVLSGRVGVDDLKEKG